MLFGTREPITDVPLERLEEEIRSLSGHLAAATCAFLVMVGEYDARLGWHHDADTASMPTTSSSGNDGGPTDRDNLVLVRRHHHRVAHRRGRAVTLTDDHWTEWTDPDGVVHEGQRYHSRAGP